MTRRAMLIPKTTGRSFIPAVGCHELPFLLGKIAMPERKALAQICETADVLMVEGNPWLLMPADPGLLDTLAVFGADAEDRENDLEDEPDEGEEDDRDSDNALDLLSTPGGIPVMDQGDKEPDDPEARKRFIKARQLPERLMEGGETRDGLFWRPIVPLRYDCGKDEAELRKAEAFAKSASSRT